MIDWVPTPTFLYRHYLYEKILNNISNKGKFFLIGTGNGYFINILKDKKFKGTCIDISKESVLLSQKNVGKNKNIVIKNIDLFKYKGAKVEEVFCFEVIEHIDKDEKAIGKIRKLIKPGGKFVMSVPAHMKLWGKIDEIGGHYRRYERPEIIEKLKKADFKVEKIWCYGFPILNIVRDISKSGKFVKNKSSKDVKDRIKKSGIRTEYDSRLEPIIANKILWLPLFKIMDLFLNTDLGLGYIIVAKAI